MIEELPDEERGKLHGRLAHELSRYDKPIDPFELSQPTDERDYDDEED